MRDQLEFAPDHFWEIRETPYEISIKCQCGKGWRGQYGEPTIFTEWYDALSGSEASVLRDYRYPAPHRHCTEGIQVAPSDLKPCEHYKAVYGDV